MKLRALTITLLLLVAVAATAYAQNAPCATQGQGQAHPVITDIGILRPFDRAALRRSSPTKVRSSVVLPMPLGPITATRSPTSTDRLSPLNSGVAP